MGKNKSSNPEPESAQRNEREVQAETGGIETERRLAALEKTTQDLNNRVFDSHKWFTTVLFSAVAVVLTVYGVLSRLDVKDATAKVDKATQDMKNDFRTLAGDALKKPLLQAVTQDGSLLDGKTNELFSGAGDGQIYTVFLENIGDKRTEPISIKFSLPSGFQLWGADYDNWQQAPTAQKDFGISFYSTKTTMTVAPKQTMNVPPLRLQGNLAAPVLCELEVFYGGEQPLRTRFHIKSP